MASKTSDSGPDRLQRMPEHILSRIFSLATANLPIVLPLQSLNVIQFTLLFVCRVWNAIAVGTPSIWASVVFELEAISTPPPMTATLVHQFSICLKRSGNNLLTIVFSPNSGGWGFLRVNSILELCHLRTKSLTCMLNSRRDMDAFLSLPPGTFPTLQYIKISFVNTISPTHTSVRNLPASAFWGALSLKTAIFHRIHGLNPMKLRLPWTEVTHLDLGGTPMSPSTFIKVMRYTSYTLHTAFIFVELNGPLDTALMALSENSIPFQVLTTLRLRLAYPNLDWRILSLLHIPCLVNLRLEMVDISQRWAVSHIARLLLPSSGSLQQLHLSDFRLSGHPLVRIHQETTHTELYSLLNIVPKIDTLRLPISIPMHATTIDSIASGEILKNMSTMECSYSNIWHGLSLVRRRRDLARMSLREQGCSTAERSAGPVSSIDSLSLWVPSHQCNMEEIFAVNAERQILVSEGFVGHIHIHPTTDLPLPFSD